MTKQERPVMTKKMKEISQHLVPPCCSTKKITIFKASEKLQDAAEWLTLAAVRPACLTGLQAAGIQSKHKDCQTRFTPTLKRSDCFLLHLVQLEQCYKLPYSSFSPFMICDLICFLVAVVYCSPPPTPWLIRTIPAHQKLTESKPHFPSGYTDGSFLLSAPSFSKIYTNHFQCKMEVLSQQSKSHKCGRWISKNTAEQSSHTS